MCATQSMLYLIPLKRIKRSSFNLVTLGNMDTSNIMECLLPVTSCYIRLIHELFGEIESHCIFPPTTMQFTITYSIQESHAFAL